MIREFLSKILGCPSDKEVFFHHLDEYYASKIPSEQLKAIGTSYWKHIAEDDENYDEHERELKEFYSEYGNADTAMASIFLAEYAVEHSRISFLLYLVEQEHVCDEDKCMSGGSFLYQAIDLDIDAATQSGDRLDFDTTIGLLNIGLNKLTKMEQGNSGVGLNMDTSIEDIRHVVKKRGGAYALEVFDECIQSPS